MMFEKKKKKIGHESRVQAVAAAGDMLLNELPWRSGKTEINFWISDDNSWNIDGNLTYSFHITDSMLDWNESDMQKLDC